jgi:Zn-dependent peptidase ImmA (M78 family)
MGARAHTTPSVLRWARETAGYSLEAAARKAKVREQALLAAENGDHLLTLRQAQAAAEAYGRSLATLMRAQPPDEPTTETRFRRLRDAPEPPWSPDLIRLEREIRDRQEAAADLYRALGEEIPWHEARRRLQLPRLPEPAFVAHLLDLEPYRLRTENHRDVWHSRRVVVRSVEWAGVLVIRAPIPDEGVRGFALPHPDVPAIYTNSSEDARAQTYTVIHEFAHLLLDAAGRTQDDDEAWCDAFAADLLMPKEKFAEAVGSHGSMDAVAHDFGVTPAAAATRAAKLRLITWTRAREILDRPHGLPAIRGGNGNRRKVARLSPTFTDLVLAAADSSTVTLSTASQLLQTKVEDFEKLRAITRSEFSAVA